jgi:hypothetical protein
LTQPEAIQKIHAQYLRHQYVFINLHCAG